MSGFGKKGLGPGQAAPSRRGGFGQAIPAQRIAASDQFDPLAAKREAFLAAERARRMAESPGQGSGCDSPGVTDLAANYRSTLPQVAPNRSLALAYLFWFILGQLSVHRFYLGATQSAVAQVGVLICSVVCMLIFPPLGFIGLIGWLVWIIADLFLMPGLHRSLCRPDASRVGIFS